MMGTIEGCVGVLRDCLPKLGEGVFKEGKEVSLEGGGGRAEGEVRRGGVWMKLHSFISLLALIALLRCTESCTVWGNFNVRHFAISVINHNHMLGCS